MTVNGENLTAIKSKALEIVAEGNEHEKKLKSLQSMADAKIYSLDYIVELRDKEFLEHKSKDYAMREELKNRIDNLFNELNEAKANISNPVFRTSLNLINNLGEELDAKTLNDIVCNFRGQFAELRLLQKACTVSGVGSAVCVFDDYLFSEGDCERLKRQVDNLLIFSHSFGIVSDILGEDVKIDAETVSADAGRAFNNRMVL